MFRSNADESSIWQESYYNNLKKVPLLIGEIGSYESGKQNNRFPIIKDIPLIEDIVRRKKSKHISFDGIIEQIGQLSGTGELQEYKIHMSDMIEIIR
jgi:flagellar biosynthesis/type III secretory pathway ATPase